MIRAADTPSGSFDATSSAISPGLTRIYWTLKDARRGAAARPCVAKELGCLRERQSRVAKKGLRRAGSRYASSRRRSSRCVALVIADLTHRICPKPTSADRWREHLTGYFVDGWIGPYVTGHAAAPPRHRQLRPAHPEDTSSRERARAVAVAALPQATLISFSGVLWRLSGTWPLRIGEHEFWIPARCGSDPVLDRRCIRRTRGQQDAGRHQLRPPALRGRLPGPSVRCDYYRERPSRSRAARPSSAASRCRASRRSLHQLVGSRHQRRNLTMLTGGIGQAERRRRCWSRRWRSSRDALTLGGVTETGIAYGQVSGALSWFIDAYREIAAWRARASVPRRSQKLDETRRDVELPGAVRRRRDGCVNVHVVDLSPTQPSGEPIATGLQGDPGAEGARPSPVPRVSAKTTRFRAIAGIMTVSCRGRSPSREAHAVPRAAAVTCRWARCARRSRCQRNRPGSRTTKVRKGPRARHPSTLASRLIDERSRGRALVGRRAASAAGVRARCCTRPTGSSWTTRPRRSTRDEAVYEILASASCGTSVVFAHEPARRGADAREQLDLVVRKGGAAQLPQGAGPASPLAARHPR